MRTLSTITLGSFLRTLGIVVLLLLLTVYVHFQARFFLQGPMLTLDSDIPVLHHEQTVVITGTARNIVKLTLNGREIHTDKEGAFHETLILERGYTITTLWAEDRFGRETTITKTLVYEPLPDSTDTP